MQLMSSFQKESQKISNPDLEAKQGQCGKDKDEWLHFVAFFLDAMFVIPAPYSWRPLCVSLVGIKGIREPKTFQKKQSIERPSSLCVKSFFGKMFEFEGNISESFISLTEVYSFIGSWVFKADRKAMAQLANFIITTPFNTISSVLGHHHHCYDHWHHRLMGGQSRPQDRGSVDHQLLS